MLEKFLTETLKLAPRQMWGVEQLGVYFKKLFSSKGAKAVVACVVAIAEMLGLIVFDFATTPRGEALDLTGYSLVFEDEFEGDSLNLDDWRYVASGRDRGGFNSPSQVSVKDGNLIMTAEYNEDGTYGAGWYGADIALNEWYKQGYFEIKCKVNAGGGFWSAFWIQAKHPYEAQYSQGGVGGAELDIFEAMGWNEFGCHNSVAQTIHCAGVGGVQEGFQSRMLGCFNGNNIYEEYNTYGLKWTEEEYIFYVNGVETVRSTFGDGVSQVEEQVRVSLCIPTAEELEKLDKETYNNSFVIDYVKIYQPTLTAVD